MISNAPLQTYNHCCLQSYRFCRSTFVVCFCEAFVALIIALLYVCGCLHFNVTLNNLPVMWQRELLPASKRYIFSCTCYIFSVRFHATQVLPLLVYHTKGIRYRLHSVSGLSPELHETSLLALSKKWILRNEVTRVCFDDVLKGVHSYMYKNVYIHE